MASRSNDGRKKPSPKKGSLKMADKEFVVVAFPVLEFPELKRYTHPSIVTDRWGNQAAADQSAEEMNLLADLSLYTYEAMSREEFNNLEW
jgi:hypothetical protein